LDSAGAGSAAPLEKLEFAIISNAEVKAYNATFIRSVGNML
jgi:hypothetical protein